MLSPLIALWTIRDEDADRAEWESPEGTPQVLVEASRRTALDESRTSWDAHREAVNQGGEGDQEKYKGATVLYSHIVAIEEAHRPDRCWLFLVGGRRYLIPLPRNVLAGMLAGVYERVNQPQRIVQSGVQLPRFPHPQS